MNKFPSDIDLATDALPNQMIEMFKKEKIRVLNLKGLKHGTVPIRINDKVTIFLRLYNLERSLLIYLTVIISQILKLQL